MAFSSTSPQMLLFFASCASSFFASPPMSPPMDLMGFFSGWVAEERMISHAFPIR